MRLVDACCVLFGAVVFAVACGTSNPDRIDSDGRSTSSKGGTNAASNGSFGGGSLLSRTSTIGELGSSVNSPTTERSDAGRSTSVTSQSASGGNPGTSIPTAGGVAQSTDPSSGGTGVTTDPPPGGTGNTTDPPPGGTGNTTDPPPGGTGNTIDPPPGGTGNTIDPPKGGTGNVLPGCTIPEVDKVNVIVFDDASPSGADAEGRMWVGGDLDVKGGYSVNATTIPELATSCNDFALVVGGDISGNPIVPQGKVAYGGTFEGSFSGGCGIFHTSPIDFSALEAEWLGYCAVLRDYPTNGTATAGGGTLTLSGTDPKLNVFTISADQLENTLKLEVPSTCSVIVNVSGKTVVWQNQGFLLPDGAGTCKSGQSSWCHRILYNLYEATTVKLGGIGVQGSVYAPYAAIDGGGGNIDGQLVCKSLTGGIEYHPYFFTGCLLLPDDPRRQDRVKM